MSNILLGKSREITMARMKTMSQIRNDAQVRFYLVVKENVKSIKNNIA